MPFMVASSVCNYSSLRNVGPAKKCFRNRFQPIIIQECMHPSIILLTTLKPRSSLCKHNTKLLSSHVQPVNQKSAMSAQAALSAPDKSVTTQTLTPSILLRFPIGKLPHVAGAQERPAQKKLFFSEHYSDFCGRQKSKTGFSCV